MRLLFEIDKKDYRENGTVYVRPSVRGIIRKEGKLAMIYSRRYNYYKFPGGGIEPGESHEDTLIREVREESGLHVIRESIEAYGYVHRVQKGKIEDKFIQDNFYYLCDAGEESGEQQLDDYEDEEQFTLVYVTPVQAMEVNRSHIHRDKKEDSSFQVMLERENRVMEMLVRDFGDSFGAYDGGGGLFLR